MDSPILAWLRPAAVRSRPDNEEVAPARRCGQQQSIGGRLRQPDLEAPGRGSREEARADLVSRHYLCDTGQPVLATARALYFLDHRCADTAAARQSHYPLQQSQS